MLARSWPRLRVVAVLVAITLQLPAAHAVRAQSEPFDYLPAASELPVPFRGSWARVEQLEDDTLAVARYVHQGRRSAVQRPLTLVMLAAQVKDPTRTATLYRDWIEIWEERHGTTFAPLEPALGDAAVSARWMETQDGVVFERMRVFFRCADVLGYADSVAQPGLADFGDVLDVATLIVERIQATPRPAGSDPDSAPDEDDEPQPEHTAELSISHRLPSRGAPAAR